MVLQVRSNIKFWRRPK